jgi:hypothetical protein
MNASESEGLCTRMFITIRLLCLAFLYFYCNNVIYAQQFNSDSWLSKPEGTITIIPTYGQRNWMLMTTYSLFPKWEFTVASYMYNNDRNPATDDGYSSSLYAKYMIYENKAETGGVAVKAGTGLFPGNINAEDRTKNAFRTFWTNFPCTIPFFNDKLSWDLMPGASVTRHYGDNNELAWGFTYSTRVAWYAFNPRLALVGEVFGSAGEVVSIPEYKAGLRWEPSKYAVFAVTYGQEFHGSNGAGLEFGLMLFTPQFACFGGCKTHPDK